MHFTYIINQILLFHREKTKFTSGEKDIIWENHYQENIGQNHLETNFAETNFPNVKTLF